MDHVAGPLHILLAEKEGRIWFNIICLKLYQFERTIWWCLSVLESILDYVMKFVMLKILKKKPWSPEICVRPAENFWRPWNLIHSAPCRTPCRLFIHEVFFWPLDLHLRVWSELGPSWSPPFRTMRALTLKWSWAFNLVCEVALTICICVCIYMRGREILLRYELT